MIAAAVLLAAAALAFANGANDNFKGVATLHGSSRASYRPVLALATLTTLAGSLSAVVIATGLARRFSGRGLVPVAVAGEPVFLLSATLGAAATVLLATRLGFPVSTTHALTGGLLGAGLAIAGPGGVAFGALGSAFLVPLLVSPLAALLLAGGLRPALRRLEAALPPEPVCLCAGPASAAAPAGGGLVALDAAPSVRVGRTEKCERHGSLPLVSFAPRAVVDVLHATSAGAVGFARGLNDTPKLAGLLIGLKLLTPGLGTVTLAVVMALGGLLAARRVANTLSFGITGMSGTEGLGANVVTAGLVILASPLGLPVSTTHVSCGALFGIGAANGEARWRMIAAIAGAWAVTLPIAAILAGAAAAALVPFV